MAGRGRDGDHRWLAAEIAEPEAGALEIVDALDAEADVDGWAAARLDGPRGRFTVAFRPEQLPFVTIWRSRAAGDYALGLEPGTCWPAHADGPDRGKAGIELAPGETHTVDLTLTVEPR